jgi:hypothetical protein
MPSAVELCVYPVSVLLRYRLPGCVQMMLDIVLVVYSCMLCLIARLQSTDICNCVCFVWLVHCYFQLFAEELWTCDWDPK